MKEVTSLILVIPGKPVPLSRTGHGQFGGKFLSSKSSRQIGLIVDKWQREGEPRLPDVALKMECTFIFERPGSHFGTGRNAGKLKPSAPKYPTGRPDSSNLVKLVEDALNGNAFKDDSRIVHSQMDKAYGTRAETVIAIATKDDTILL